VEGKANQALIRFLADRLSVPRSRIAILAGNTGRDKRIDIRGITVAQFVAALAAQP